LFEVLRRETKKWLLHLQYGSGGLEVWIRCRDSARNIEILYTSVSQLFNLHRHIFFISAVFPACVDTSMPIAPYVGSVAQCVSQPRHAWNRTHENFMQYHLET
jgi:hypothetical protein